MQRINIIRLFNSNKNLIRCASCYNLTKINRISSINCISTQNSIKNGRNLLNINSNTNYIQKCFYSSSLPPHKLVGLPALSPTMEHGTLAKWCKKEGDQVLEGDVIAEIETDKATMALEATDEGFIAKLLVAEKTKEIPLRTLLFIVVNKKEDIAAFKDFVAPTTPPPPRTATPPAPPAAAPQPTPQATSTQSPPPPPPPPPSQPAAAAAPVASTPTPLTKSGGRIFATPLAKKIAAERGIDLASITQASGPDNQIRAQDVLNHVTTKAPSKQELATSTAAAAASQSQYIDTPLTTIRSVIAKRLLQSKQTIPHYYLTVDMEIDNVLKIRKELNESMVKDNVKLSINDFVIKAAAFACKKVPDANSAWMDTFIRQFSNVDISVAVATDNGLITPIVFNADKKGLASINFDVASLAQKARTGKLQPHEFQGGTFTISNLGMFGVKSFSAVINPPQACILAVGGTEKRVVPSSDGGVRTATVMTVTLSCDHRVVDGAVGAKWLEYFKKYMENPASMLL